ncbi:TolC family protein [Noviherbaspirillum suwonense]|uniref:Outer membrane protein, cobalt-zinc-cadmium efflux system n=1 Tax=Noviherbaspirillum suwonense TaxID=1224511 RepID=A0ABY1PZ39_9BURK|nr:TolC family protein [Noviherbaspirillum suwonense]SMP52153.1 outer membrane protein, cobalt-zinc-cadmium efflux system [Noviherbaspirillum suwonense]
MYKFLLPLMLVASIFLPAAAQTLDLPRNGDMAQASPDRPAKALEPSGPLTLQSALALALSANAEVSAARYELAAVEASVVQAGASPNPSLGVQMQDTRRTTRETTVQLSQPFELGGKRAARIQAAERGRDAAGAELGAKQAEVRAAVISSFFDLMIAQERVRLAQESADLAQRASTVASKRVIAGKVSPVEETRARVAETGVRLELLQARSDLTSARKRLSAMWGSLTPRFERAEGELQSLPALPDPAALSAGLVSSPALARARFEVDRRQALARLERSRRTPDVTVSLGVNRNEELGRNQAIVGVSVPLPIFDTNRGNVLEALRRTDKARDELAAVEIRLGSELALAVEKLTTSRQEVQALQQDILPGAQSAYEAATTGFEYGKFGFLDVLDAQRTLLQARSQYLRALSEVHRAGAEIDRILGAPMAAANQ